MSEWNPSHLDEAHLRAHAEYATKMSEYWKAIAARDLAELALRVVASEEHYTKDLEGQL